MVRADVRQHARLVALVADAPQEDPAAGRLEDRHVDVAAAEDRRRPAGARPVARLHHPPVDDDPVRRRHADPAPGAAQDVGDHPGDGASCRSCPRWRPPGSGAPRPGSSWGRGRRRPRSATSRPRRRDGRRGHLRGRGAPRRRAARRPPRGSAPARRRARGTRRSSGPGSAPRWTWTSAAGPLPGLLAQASAPAGQAGDLRRPAARRDVRPEARGHALAPRRARRARRPRRPRRPRPSPPARGGRGSALPGGGSRRGAPCAEDTERRATRTCPATRR